MNREDVAQVAVGGRLSARYPMGRGILARMDPINSSPPPLLLPTGKAPGESFDDNPAGARRRLGPVKSLEGAL